MADQIPSDLRYSKDHEWARVQGDTVRIGITWHAQDQLGDVVFVELPAVGTKVEKGKQFGVVESTKAVSELFSPVTGTVKAVNDALTKAPDKVNTEPYGAAWMIEVQLSDPKEVGELLDAKAYGELTKS
jgi:glycine cleavage system H protein